ncbi:MAG: hypothetical protein ACETWK_02405 [Candidatus Aminicenantaceae bacterium]
MKCLYSLKMLPWHLFMPHNSSLKKKARKGAMSLISIFVFFLFSALGLSLLYLSQIHLRISFFKKQSTFLEYTSENGIKQGFDNLVNLITQASSPSILTSEQLEQLREDVRSNGSKIIELILDVKLPLVISETWGKQNWESRTDCSLDQLFEGNNYFIALYKTSINSVGTMDYFKQKCRSTLLSSLRVHAGHLPLSSFPFLIDKILKPGEEEIFTEKNNVSITPSRSSCVQPRIIFSEKELIPQEAPSELSKALKINIFYPQDLSTAQLRTALGLDESEEPVPDGVYLIKDDLGLGGIYVQGDVDEMVLAIDEDFQVISFRISQAEWILKYSPSRSRTYFFSSLETLSYDLIPLGIIIVNGKIQSLGGGILDSSGKVTIVKDREIPSVLEGIQLTVISSDKITISSNLILQGVKWQEGVPYAKDSKSHLAIFSTGKNFWDEITTTGGITIDKTTQSRIKVHAALAASGEGFVIEGEGREVEILGGIQASDFISERNTLKITFDDRPLEGDNLDMHVPHTTRPVLFISSFRVEEWEDF